MLKRIAVVVVWAGAIPMLAAAGDLTPPFSLETAAVLPKGVGNPRLVNIYMQGDGRYGGGGQVESLGSPLNKPVKWSDVVAAAPDKTSTRGFLAAEQASNGSGFKESDLAGYSSGAVTSYANAAVPIVAFGVSERFTLAVALPIMHVEVNVDTGFKKNAASTKFMQDYYSSTGSGNEAAGSDAAAKLNDPIGQKLAKYGYAPIRSKTVSGIGDAQLCGKYLFVATDNHAFSLKNTLVLPTGAGPDSDQALDVPLGDARYQIGMTPTYDYRLPVNSLRGDFRANTYLGAQALLPNRMKRRIPTSADDSLSGDSEEVTRRLGGQFTAGAGLEYASFYGPRFGAGWQSSYRTSQQFAPGENPALANRYELLNDLYPSQTLHSMILSAGFSTIELYNAKKFVYPFQLNVAYSRPLTGRNVSTNDLVAGELVLFF